MANDAGKKPKRSSLSCLLLRDTIVSTMIDSLVRRRRTRVVDGLRIRQADASLAVLEGLTDVLIDCVEGGASVSFMAPLARDRAVAFWRSVLDGVSRGERVVLVAEDPDTGRIVGTVQVVLSMPDNQPHRAEVAKMLVRRDARRQGLGAALMRAAEAVARSAGRTLLVLDTVTGSDAERLYTRLGWERCGVIPGFALLPRGGLCATTIFYRKLGDSAADTAPGAPADPPAQVVSDP